ncbi:MAG: hypothetical protein AAB459_00155 [Patescibacteria group bacterium]
MKAIHRNEALILGYGLFRNHTEEPWFRCGDINQAMTNDENHPYKPIPPGSFTLVRNRLRDASMIETWRGDSNGPGAPSEHRFVKVTDLGEELLIGGVMYMVRHKGLTVPAILEIPEAINAFLAYTEFETRIVQDIIGVGGLAISTSIEL